jgi:hypothetical protein
VIKRSVPKPIGSSRKVTLIAKDERHSFSSKVLTTIEVFFGSTFPHTIGVPSSPEKSRRFLKKKLDAAKQTASLALPREFAKESNFRARSHCALWLALLL